MQGGAQGEINTLIMSSVFLARYRTTTQSRDCRQA